MAGAAQKGDAVKTCDRKSGGETLSVLGGGSWGTTLGVLQSPNFRRVNIFTPEMDACEEMNRYRSNNRYLEGLRLPANIFSTTSLSGALDGAEMLLVAVPSSAVREVASQVRALSCERLPVVLATKGLENGTGLLSLEVWRQVTSAPSRRSLATDPLVLSGPNLAKEICSGIPVLSVLAGERPCEVWRAVMALRSPAFNLVPFHDPMGVQVAGALKNVYAVGCGMASELGWGHNTVGALIWRGLDETSRFAQALGGDPRAAMTPAGLADFIATCCSPLSRNHDLGRVVAGAQPGEGIVGVREGSRTAAEALRRARSLRLELPLLQAVGAVLSGTARPEEVLSAAVESPEPEAPAAHPSAPRPSSPRLRPRGLEVAAE